ncbi:putative HVA22-like protein g [Senna tora]|uniref:HVA22-like protein n=1 Tax=Senna tora TaxID=362788 RepID=A0A834TBB8_9FABA|nr:putative HVA22-like protein g [Senna tora]
MLGEFITRCLILLLGYAYPGFQCYKTVEKNKVQIEELRFWCQYWILVAFLTVLEDIADIFIAWLPMYGELKLALFIYLCGYIYDAVLRPYVTTHENDIENKLLEWRARIWDLAVFYLQNCTEFGQSAFLQTLEYFAGQSKRFHANPTTQKIDMQSEVVGSQFPPTPKRSSFFGNRKNKKSTSPSSETIYRNISETPKFDTVELRLDSRTEYLRVEEVWEPEPRTSVSPQPQHDDVNAKDKATDCIEYPVENPGYTRNEMVKEEVETSSERIRAGPKVAEEGGARWAGRGSGHGLEVSPSGLLDEAVANRDLVARSGGERGSVEAGTLTWRRRQAELLGQHDGCGYGVPAAEGWRRC